ncbi:MAG: DUF4349 domain-containing protein [Lachnospiraceae bacterium]|nr:DUF4349 domain-containing protein [Lachnospiraceae bacterium]
MKTGKQLKRIYAMLLCILLITQLTACGSSNRSYEETSTESTAAYDSAMAPTEEAAMEAPIADESYKAVPEAEGAVSGSQGQTLPATNRKLIKNVNMNVETQEFNAVLSTVRNKVSTLGGYIESMNIGENGYSTTDTTRYANVTARIPADQMDGFVENVETISNMISKSETVQDVTLQYVDIESHKKMLLAEQDSLLRLLEKAETIEDIITIESRLSEVRYQIESMESQLRTYDNQIDYSTVYLYITEVERLTPPEEKEIGDRISIGFWENVYKVQEGLKEFVIRVIINIPYIIVLLAVALILFILARIIIKIERRSLKKRQSVNATRHSKENQNLNNNASSYADLYHKDTEPKNLEAQNMEAQDTVETKKGNQE